MAESPVYVDEDAWFVTATEFLKEFPAREKPVAAISLPNEFGVLVRGYVLMRDEIPEGQHGKFQKITHSRMLSAEERHGQSQ